MNPPSSDDTLAMHQHYCAITGLEIPYTMQRHYQWEKWLISGFTARDLSMAVRYIMRRIRERRREKESLLFRNLIGNPENFGEDLAMARHEQRGPTVTERERILNATGRLLPEDRPAVTPKQVIERMVNGNVTGEHEKMAALLRQWKEAN